MSTSIRMSAGLLAGLLVCSGATFARAQGKAADCPKPTAVEKVEGHVVRVDPNQGMLTVRAADGTSHEFQVSKETLQDMKVGDRIQAKLRISESCKKS